MPLHGKNGLVVGIANEHSIAYGYVAVFRHAGAELAITYLNAKAEAYVRPLAERLKSPIIVPCDVRVPGQIGAVVFAHSNRMGVRSISYCTRSPMRRRGGLAQPDHRLLAGGFCVGDGRCPVIPLSAWRAWQNRSWRVVAVCLPSQSTARKRWSELLERARSRAPEHQLVSRGCRQCRGFSRQRCGGGATGNIEYIDAGYHVLS